MLSQCPSNPSSNRKNKKQRWAAAVTAAAAGLMLLGGVSRAADVTLTSANNSGYTWGTAGETLNVTLNSADKFAGPFTLTDGTAKFASNYASNTLGSGASIVLGAGTTLDFNGMYLNPATISTTGAAAITSSQQNTQYGIGAITSLGGDLTLAGSTRYCITGAMNASNHSIYKTGSNEIVVKANLNNLSALHIQAGTWAVESSVAGFGTGDVYLGSGATMKVWGSGCSVSFSKLYYNGGTVNLYTDGYSGTIDLTGDIVLQADNANFRISSTTTFTGNISGAGYTLVHSAYVTPGPNGDHKDQTGVWTFKSGTTSLANFKLTTRDSEIILGDSAVWTLTGDVAGSSSGHIFTESASASLTAANISGIKTLTLNGTTNLSGGITMNQADGVLTVGAGASTTLASLTFSANTTLADAGALTTSGASSIASDVTVKKTGAATLTLGENLTGTGTLEVQAGKLTQTAGSTKINSFGGEIVLYSGTELVLNGEQAAGPAITCKDGSKVSNSRSSSNVNWVGASNLNLETGATVELGGTSRFAFTLKNSSGNGGTLKITNNNYVFLNSKIENVTVLLSGVLGIEGGTTLTGSEGKEVALILDGGTVTSWTGTGTHTLNPSSIEITSKGGTFKTQGNLVFNGDVTLNGNMILNPVSFTSTNNYHSTARFNGDISGNYTISAEGVGTDAFYGDVDVKTFTLTNGGVYIKDGTFDADVYNINKSYGTTTLSGGTFESGLIVDGGTLVSSGTFNAAANTQVVMRSGAMSLGGTVSDAASSSYKIDGGILTLDDGAALNGSLNLGDSATLKVGFDSTQPATVSLLSNNNNLDGVLVFDLFSPETFDVLNVGTGSTLDGAEILLNISGAETNYNTLVPIISGTDLSAISVSLQNSGWALAFDANGLSVRNIAATPEPASWLLLLLASAGLCTLNKRNRFSHK